MASLRPIRPTTSRGSRGSPYPRATLVGPGRTVHERSRTAFSPWRWKGPGPPSMERCGPDDPARRHELADGAHPRQGAIPSRSAPAGEAHGAAARPGPRVSRATTGSLAVKIRTSRSHWPPLARTGRRRCSGGMHLDLRRDSSVPAVVRAAGPPDCSEALVIPGRDELSSCAAPRPVATVRRRGDGGIRVVGRDAARACNFAIEEACGDFLHALVQG